MDPFETVAAEAGTILCYKTDDVWTYVPIVAWGLLYMGGRYVGAMPLTQWAVELSADCVVRYPGGNVARFSDKKLWFSWQEFLNEQ